MGLDSAQTAEKMVDFVERRRPGAGVSTTVCAKSADFGWKSAKSLSSRVYVEKINSHWAPFSKLESARLLQLIQESIERVDTFHPNYESLLQDGLQFQQERVTSSDRYAAVGNLRCLHIFYHFTPETFALAVNLLDRFLTKMKARPKYLSCIAMSCYFIAIKTCEESQSVPRLCDLLTVGQCSFKPSDILRMEAIILQKLNFEVNAVTPLRFLEYFFALILAHHPWLSSYLMIELLISNLEICLSHVSMSSCQAHVLAISLINHALQESDLSQDESLHLSMINLQTFSQIKDNDLRRCHNNVKTALDAYANSQSQTPKTKLQWRMSSRTISQIIRPSFHGYSDLPIILENKPIAYCHRLGDDSCLEENNNRIAEKGPKLEAYVEDCSLDAQEENPTHNRIIFHGEA